MSGAGEWAVSWASTGATWGGVGTDVGALLTVAAAGGGEAAAAGGLVVSGCVTGTGGDGG